jgi:multimeric flavodoxin WrbA
MKALFIVGSPREKGCSSLIVDRVIDGLEGKIDIVKHVLGKRVINYCLGCKACSTTRRCIQRDDMDILFRDMYKSDIIIIAAPSYWGDVPGQLKVFFDRSTPLCNTNQGGTPIPKGKKGYSIAIRAGNRAEENMQLIKSIEHYFSHLEIEPMDRLSFEGIKEIDDVLNNPDVLQKAYEFGQKIASSFEY